MATDHTENQDELMRAINALIQEQRDNGSLLLCFGHLTSLYYDDKTAAEELRIRMMGKDLPKSISALLNHEIELFEKTARVNDDVLAGVFFRALEEFNSFSLPDQAITIYERQIKNSRGLFWKNYAYIEISRILAGNGRTGEQLELLQELVKSASYSPWEKIALFEISSIYRGLLLKKENFKIDEEGSSLESPITEEDILDEEAKELIRAEARILFHYLDKFLDEEALDRLFSLARIMENNGLADDAFGIYNYLDTKDIGPYATNNLTAMGLLLYRQGRVDQGITVLERLFYNDANQELEPKISYHLASMYEKKGLLRKAQTIYAKLMSGQPSLWGNKADEGSLRVAMLISETEPDEGIETLQKHIAYRYSKKNCSAAQLAIAHIGEKQYRRLASVQDESNNNRGTNNEEMQRWKKIMDEAYLAMIRNYPDTVLIDEVPERYFDDENPERKRKRLTLIFSIIGAFILLFILRLYLSVHFFLLPVLYFGFFGLTYFFYYVILH